MYKRQEVDPATNKITAHCSFPDYDMNYTVNVEPEGTGIKVTVNLENPLPEILEGRAGFNLEFLPTTYRGKTYSVDGSEVGVFPMSPKDDMESCLLYTSRLRKQKKIVSIICI